MKSHVFIHMLSTAAFTWQSCVVIIETVWPTKPEIFTIWPFTEKVCQLLEYVFTTQCYNYVSLPGGTSGKNLTANTGDLRDSGSIPWSGRTPGEGNGNPLPYSCLENPMDRRAQQIMVHRMAKNGHDWRDLACTHSHIIILLCYLSLVQNFRLFIHSSCNIGSTQLIFFKWTDVYMNAKSVTWGKWQCWARLWEG